MLHSAPFEICTSCSVKLTTSFPSQSQILTRRAYSRIKSPKLKRLPLELPTNESNIHPFRRNTRFLSTPKDIPPIHSTKYRISKEFERKITFCLRLASLYQCGLLPQPEAKQISERLVSTIFDIDSYLGQKGKNPSILFTIFHHEPSRLKNVISLLSFLKVTRPSIQRDGLALGLALNFAQYSRQFPFIFQLVLLILLERNRTRKDKI